MQTLHTHVSADRRTKKLVLYEVTLPMMSPGRSSSHIPCWRSSISLHQA